MTHTDGDCAGTTNTTTTTVGSNFYDSADRATKGQGGLGAYTYDLFGRVTTLPGVDAPNPGGGDITLGYVDDDLPRTITQGGTSTTFTLDSAGRRTTATTTSTAGTTVLVRHYSDSSDNPTWVTATDPAGKVTTTRYGASIAGDLGVSIADDGTTSVTVANLHGDVLTNITIPATAASSATADGIDGWSDYTEYGTPRNSAATTVVAGAGGYGWLGAKQRATSADTAGLTLMGDRLYNPATGRFTALDPVAGGNANQFAYPVDPVNSSDLSGHCLWDLCVGEGFAVYAAGAAVIGGVLAWSASRHSRRSASRARSLRYSFMSMALSGAVHGILWFGKRKAKNSGRTGHRKGKNHEKHSSAEGHSGRVNPNYKGNPNKNRRPQDR